MFLAGDIGGTKTRLALIDPADGRFARVHVFASRDYDGLAAIVRAFAAGDLAGADRAAFCVAGPVVEGKARPVNLGWEVDGAALARELHVADVLLLNDLEGMAYGIASVPPDALQVLNPGTAPREGNGAVIAAGTGLGEALLLRANGGTVAVATEGGHADFAPRTDEEIELLRYLRGRYGRVSYERILSGPGLANVYDFLRGTRTARPDARPPLDGPGITRAALEDHDPLARETLRLFASVYGAEAGNLVLRGVAVGGVYVAGGIAPRIAPALEDGAFLDAYGDKGRLSSLVRSTPVHLVRDEYLALRGAAARLLARDDDTGGS